MAKCHMARVNKPNDDDDAPDQMFSPGYEGQIERVTDKEGRGGGEERHIHG